MNLEGDVPAGLFIGSQVIVPGRMKMTRLTLALFAVNVCVLAVSRADAELIPSPDGLTVYDTVLHVMWLADANLAATETFGVDDINPKGSMDFSTARRWVDALNGLNGGAPYLGHNDWTLPNSPTFPATDPTCSATGPNDNSFGYGCLNSAMGSLFYRSLGLHYPDTAVPIPDNTVFPFRNFQPYLYWSKTSSNGNGYHTFSFNTGWTGSNVDGHYMYVLPMIKHKVERPGIAYEDAGVNGLLVSSDGETVYDPGADVTWLADADLAKTHSFGAQCLNVDGTLCINPDGSMAHTTAQNWIDGLNTAGWLGQTTWQLPPTDTDDPCGIPALHCEASPMGELFYQRLGLKPGQPVIPTPDIEVGPFRHLQPYLYWSCGSPDAQTGCQEPAAPGFEWSFSFGNGFQGTDPVGNNLYVTVYYPESPAEALAAAITAALGADPEFNAFLSQAADISSAPNAGAKTGQLRAFIGHVNAQRGKALTPAQADQLIALAQAI